jgi:acyl-homoserine-lactone acylase
MVAMRVAAIDRPRLFEQFWRMGLAHNLAEWKDAMRCSSCRCSTPRMPIHGHIGYVYNSTLPVHATGDYRYWQGIVPGDRSDLISSTIVPFDQIPQVFDPPTGWVQNSNDMPWTSVYPMMLDPTKFAAGFAAPQGITQRAQRGIRILSGFTGKKMTFADVKAGKLSTRVETAINSSTISWRPARKIGTDRAKRAADVLAKWDRQSENTSDGTLLFYKFMTEAGNGFTNIGGFAVPGDDRQPLTTPRGFADAARAAAALDKVAGDVEKEYGRLNVPWGEVLRLRRGNVDLPGNGAPSQLGAIRTVGVSPFKDGKVEGVQGDTFFAVIEFSTPIHAEGLLSYGNWSKKGSPHVEDQIKLMSRKEMRPIWRDRKDVEGHLEAKKTF